MKIEKRNPVEHEVIEPIAKRWSPRAFADKEISKQDVYRLLEAARWSASAYNEQPWRFILATKAKKQEFDKAVSCLREGNQGWAKNAALVILTVIKKTFSNTGGENKNAKYDLGQAVSALVLQAMDLGIYAHQMAGIYPEKVREKYALAEDYEAVTAIALGYPGELEQLPKDLQEKEKAERFRKQLSEIVIELNV